MRLRRWRRLAIVGAALAAGMAFAQTARLPQGLPALHVPALDAATGETRFMLGRRLFYDADLSADGSMACATCHEQHRGFADGNRTHAGVHGDPARRNVPGLANVAWLRSLTWGDPRVRTLEAQVGIPVLGTSPVEMGMNGREAEIAARLQRNPCYRALFAKAFPQAKGGIDMMHVAMALAAFERQLVSFGSADDQARAGGAPLAPLAQSGARLFNRDCASCHAGPSFTDARFHRILPTASTDRGLGEITGKASDDGRFRTPSLRNVAVTQPYFHDGSAATLAEAIEHHPGAHPPGETKALIAFLDALTDRQFLTDARFGLPDEACGITL